MLPYPSSQSLTLSHVPSRLVLQVRGVSDACFFSWSEAAEGEDRREAVTSCCNPRSPYLCSSCDMCAHVHPSGPAAVLCSSAMAEARGSGDGMCLNRIHSTRMPSSDCDLGGESFSVGAQGLAALPDSTKMSGLRGVPDES